VAELGRRTIRKGHGGMSGVSSASCTRAPGSQIGRIKAIARAIDPKAFIVSHPVADVEGGVVKRGALH
jgi:uncharacterized membrane-anchored protein YitT (DUF2179 family)